MELRNRLFHEDYARDCQELEELRRICREETDHARQARIEELSMQQLWVRWRFKFDIYRIPCLTPKNVTTLKKRAALERPTFLNILLKVNLSCTFFEDNEAVIKMIIEDRSPTMRHVTRNHRVALDWLFDRINLEPKNQIKYVDIKKPTRWHSDHRKFLEKWVESPSVFVQHHELFDILWQPFDIFSLRGRRAYCAWCHVEARTRHDLEWES